MLMGLPTLSSMRAHTVFRSRYRFVTAMAPKRARPSSLVRANASGDVESHPDYDAVRATVGSVTSW